MSTVIELIESGAKQLEAAGVAFGHGTANAFDEAAWLVLWRLKLPLDDIDAVADTPVSPADAGKVAALIDERIASRKPAAYLTNEVAAINVTRHELDARVTLIESDGLKNLTGPYDLVLCNPPYVNSASMAALPAEYRAEPELALAGGTDGMDFVRRLFADAPSRMSEQAVLVLEIGNERDYFEAAFPQLEVVWLETSAGEDQVLLVTRAALASLTAP